MGEAGDRNGRKVDKPAGDRSRAWWEESMGRLLVGTGQMGGLQQNEASRATREDSRHMEALAGGLGELGEQCFVTGVSGMREHTLLV